MKDKLKVIGLSGTNGAGKDAAGALLAEHYGFLFFSFTELFREECHRRGLPVTRENTRMIGNEWRRKEGASALVGRSMEIFKKADASQYTGFVMSSIRNPGEADHIHELGGTVIWVDADPRTRYDRIQKNAASRGRAGEDNRTFAQFLQEEQDEMHPPKDGDAASLNMATVKERADIFITNNSDSLETLQRDTAAALGL